VACALLTVIDISVVLAILQDEPERSAINTVIAAAESCMLSAASLIELSIVLEARLGPDGQRDVDRDQAELARRALGRYGKDRHRAGLNFGDCFFYALAKGAGVPFLFKGNDLSHTDLESAWNPAAS
jgi:ribonuclease VapC